MRLRRILGTVKSNMTTVDHIVAGSGIAGLCVARLLNMAGRSVRLVEKAPRIGGSLRRFRRKGLPFDTGFHFTGALGENGILRDMLRILGMRDAVRPLFPDPDQAHRFVFESLGKEIDVPCGLPRIRARLKDVFQGESRAIDGYFDRMEHVCRGTSAMSLDALSLSPRPVDEDYVTLQETLDELTDNALLKAVLSGFCMCYGTAPAQVSFANHARICLAMYEGVARVEHGGNAFIDAFSDLFKAGSVDISTGTWVEDCLDIENDRAGLFRLNTGEEIAASSCVLTMHPFEILRTLPRDRISKAFIDRIEAFEPSCGFFSVFGETDASENDSPTDQIVSLFPDIDLNALLDPTRTDDSALVILNSAEPVGTRTRLAVTGLEIASQASVAPWRNTRTGHRPPEYQAYKTERAERMLARMKAYSGVYGDRFRLLDNASPLTFRDWLHSPDGSAYGVRQKMGQYNLFGKLPVRNMYAAGQSAVLPGLVGAMVSAFMICRAVLGKDAFARLLHQGRQ